MWKAKRMSKKRLVEGMRKVYQVIAKEQRSRTSILPLDWRNRRFR